jgi:hypothetical protein
MPSGAGLGGVDAFTWGDGAGVGVVVGSGDAAGGAGRHDEASATTSATAGRPRGVTPGQYHTLAARPVSVS